jgi:hypothetical protein
LKPIIKLKHSLSVSWAELPIPTPPKNIAETKVTKKNKREKKFKDDKLKTEKMNGYLNK